MARHFLISVSSDQEPRAAIAHQKPYQCWPPSLVSIERMRVPMVLSCDLPFITLSLPVTNQLQLTLANKNKGSGLYWEVIDWFVVSLNWFTLGLLLQYGKKVCSL